MESIKIDSPWFKGDTKELGKTPLMGMFEQFCLQLQHFIDTDSCPNVEYTKADIKGYKMVIASGSDENAREFLKLKEAENIGKREPLENNIKRVEHLKRVGKWTD